MRFEFATATRIVFGPGTLSEAGALVAPWGRKALVVTGMHPERAQPLRDSLDRQGVGSEVFPIEGEPTVPAVQSALEMARDCGAELVVGFGGGSAIDAAKAVAGFLTNPGDPLDYLEVVGGGQSLPNPAAPWIAIPTTAGTGAEVTRNAVLGVPGRGVKVSLRSPHLLARIALVDPELTLDLPPAVTAMTGMDALTQLLEAYVCNRANPLTDAICSAGLARSGRALPSVWRNPRDLDARTDLALSSLWSGLALSNAGLGAVHGFAAPIGGLFSAPHGAVCAILLVPVMEMNLRVAREKTSGTATVARYTEIARWLTGRCDASAKDGIAWVRDLVASLRIPRLASHGVAPENVNDIVVRAKSASSMKANPVALTDQQLAEVIASAI
ncbi:MAG: iron-containing alcohol dehydrogenase [Opitutaceae bacterium]|jgi:alcohol dehydrogenase class IV